ENEDMYLVGTAEHSLIGMFMQQVIDHTKLPIRLCGYSMSFRREVGSHGLDEKGIFRTHQFNKVEQIVLCKPEDSEQYFHELLQNTIDLFVSIGIPIRTLAICSGDLGDMKHQQYDIEAWSPRKQAYIEVGSCSNLTDNQSRLLGIKARHHDGNFFVHTLNNTAIATSRALVALLENNQLPDGRIQIPPVLQSYMGQKEFLEPGKKFL
ncbi:MAG: aminoacyl--tRNA ligase-related protein, partial [Candidatus Woesearchaeota archaeon]